MLMSIQLSRPVGASRVNTYVAAIVLLSMTAIVSVVAVSIFLRGDPENASLITTILGVISPIVAALLAAALREVHTDVNSRLTQFLELTAAASRAEGQLAQRDITRSKRATDSIPMLPGEAVETLHHIEAHTAETAAATKTLAQANGVPAAQKKRDSE